MHVDGISHSLQRALLYAGKLLFDLIGETTMGFKLIKTSISFLVLVVVPLLAADSWEKKELTAWSEKECM